MGRIVSRESWIVKSRKRAIRKKQDRCWILGPGKGEIRDSSKTETREWRLETGKGITGPRSLTLAKSKANPGYCKNKTEYINPKALDKKIPAI